MEYMDSPLPGMAGAWTVPRQTLKQTNGSIARLPGSCINVIFWTTYLILGVLKIGCPENHLHFTQTRPSVVLARPCTRHNTHGHVGVVAKAMLHGQGWAMCRSLQVNKSLSVC